MLTHSWLLSLIGPLIAIGVLVSIAGSLIAFGVIYQCLGSRRDRKRFTQDGQTVTLGNGSSVYLYRLGSGGPTVVFEAGFGATHLNWRHVQRCVSETARTIAYDRAGLGWSSPSRSARTPANIASELHEALQQAGIQPPYILVGHSFGGLVVRRFALLYPEEVAGITLVDPMRCDEWPPLNAPRQAEVDKGRRLARAAVPIAGCGLARVAAKALVRFAGLHNHAARVTGQTGTHIIQRVATEIQKMPREIWPVLAAHWSRPGFYAGMREHLIAVPATVEEMQFAAPIRGIPVTVLTPATSQALSPDCLARIGDNVEQIIAYRSAHWVHLDEPDLVIDAIRAHIGAHAGQAYAACLLN